MRTANRCLLVGVCSLAVTMLLVGCTTPPSGETNRSTQAGPPAKYKEANQTQASTVASTTETHSDRGASHASQQPLSENQRLIQSAARLTFSTERAELYERIAVRHDLTTTDQKALIDASCELGFSDQIMSIFLKLAGNSALTADGKKYLLERLDCVRFSNQRKRVFDLLP